MEQHKVLLIIVSVTIALAAVVGVGLWLFYPRDAAPEDVAVAGTPEDGGFQWEPLDYLQGRGDVPGLDQADGGVSGGEPDEFEVTYGVAADAQEPRAAEPRTLISTQPVTGGAAEPPRVSEPAPEPAVSVQQPAAVAPRESAPRATGEVAAGPTAAPSAAPATPSATAPASAAAEELSDRAYWVQAISSPNRDTVEQAQRTLREHQLGSRILTKVINDRTYYRLRIGPFSVRAEAEKFLGWVQAIDDFADAMIFVDYTTPVLAARP